MNFNAAVLVSRKKIVLDSLEIPKLRYGQALVKMLYSSICKTQVEEIFGNRGKDLYLPHCLGHEATGVVVDKHDSVKKVKIDDKVCLSWIKGIGIDSGGVEYKSLDGKKINAGPVSTFSEYAVISENRLYKLSSTDHAKNCVLLGCAIATGFNSIFYSLKGIEKGPICIFGCGGVGLSTILACKIKKLSPIIAIDVNPRKLKIAKKFGAQKVLQFDNKSFCKDLNRYCKSNFPVMIECTGKIKVLKFCIKHANHFGGKILVVGNYPKPSNILFDPWDVIMGKTLMGAWNDKDYFDEKFKFFKTKITNKYCGYFFNDKSYSLNEINHAIRDFVKGKVVRPLIKF